MERYRKLFMVFSGVFLTLNLFLVLIGNRAQGNSDKLDKISLQLSWMEDTINFSQYYWGKEIFKKYGLDVEIIPTTEGSPYVLKSLMTQNVQYGFASPATIINVVHSLREKEQVSNVFAIAPTYRVVPAGLVLRKDLKPGDVKRVAIKIGSVHQLMARTQLKKLGVSDDQIEWVPVAGGWDGIKRFILDSSIDGTFTYVDGMMKVTEEGVPFDAVTLKDSGLNFFGEALVANVNWSEQNPSITKRLIAAVAEINTLAKANPEPVINHYLSRYPHLQKNKESLLWVFGQFMDLYEAGKMTDENWRSTAELMLDSGQIKKLLPPSEYYTNKFVE